MSFLKKNLRRLFPITITEDEVRLIKTQLARIEQQSQIQSALSAQLLIAQQQQQQAQILKNLRLAEFKVSSQWGDDGMIQFLANYLDIPAEQQTFIEFGVQDYTEANTRFLLTHSNWRGLIMDGSQKHINYIQNDDIYWRFDLTAACEFITKENVNSLFEKYGFTGEIGLLHIDIDGNDYWVWQAVQVVNPIIVIVEYNAVWGDKNAWSVPYKSDFYRLDGHFSNLFWGASLPAFCHLAEQRNYAFVGCNSNGNNAYFVRKDKLKDLEPQTAKTGFVMSKFRDSRDKNGELNFLGGSQRFAAMEGLTVVDVISGQNTVIRNQ
jgi:hypothetical protein